MAKMDGLDRNFPIDDVTGIEEDIIAKEVEREIESSASNVKTSSAPQYETTVTLPTRGILYDPSENIPAEITLRGMTTREEKILYASSGRDVIKKVLKSCVVNPPDLNVDSLMADDFAFLILQLRMVTFGDDYRVSAKCPHCRATNDYKIRLSDYDVIYLDSDFKEPIDIKLPRSGDTLSVRLLRNPDTEFVEKYSKKFAKQHSLNVREVEYTTRMARYVKKINNVEVDFIRARNYVEKMTSLDSAKFWTEINKIRYGVDSNTVVTCYDCQREFNFTMPITSEFFRPTIE